MFFRIHFPIKYFIISFMIERLSFLCVLMGALRYVQYALSNNNVFRGLLSSPNLKRGTFSGRKGCVEAELVTPHPKTGQSKWSFHFIVKNSAVIFAMVS